MEIITNWFNENPYGIILLLLLLGFFMALAFAYRVNLSVKDFTLRYIILDCQRLSEELNKIVEEQEHWNSSSILPPVWIPLELKLDDGKIVKVMRDTWALNSKSNIDFTVKETGEVMTGRFKWRYA